MAKLLIGIVAVLACFYLAESLDCKKCTLSLFGFCVGSGSITCTTNTSVCYTSQCTFSSLSNFNGLSQQGCAESSTCPINATSTSSGSIGPSFFSLAYTIKSQCCNSNNCNPVDLSGGAPSHSMSLSVALSVAALAAIWGSYM